MPHQIAWDNHDKTVILQQYTSPTTKDDLYQLAMESADMLKSVDHTVHLIIDERNAKLTLNSADLRYLNKRVPPNQGIVVVVAQKHDIVYKTRIQSMAEKVAPNAFEESLLAETIEEARAMLIERFSVRYP